MRKANSCWYLLTYLDAAETSARVEVSFWADGAVAACVATAAVATASTSVARRGGTTGRSYRDRIRRLQLSALRPESCLPIQHGNEWRRVRVDNRPERQEPLAVVRSREVVSDAERRVDVGMEQWLSGAQHQVYSDCMST